MVRGRKPIKYSIEKSGCHICTSHLARDSGGYVRYGWNGKNIRMHRFIYEKYKRKIPPKMCVCHTCDNPECINPDHLFLGTQRDNVLDMIRKGRENHLRGEEHHMAKLTAIEVIEIKESEKSYIRLASQYDISVTTIWRIKKNLNWKHIFLNRDNHNATIPHRKEGC